MLEKQGKSAIWEISRFIAISGTFIGGYTMGFTAIETLVFYSIVQAIAYTALFYIIYQSVKAYSRA